MALTTSIGIKFNTLFTNALDLSTGNDPLVMDRTISFASGTGASQANMIFHDSRTLANAGTETLDLYASGALLDPFGAALTIETLKFLYIKNIDTAAGFQIGGGASFDLDIFAATSDILIIPFGGTFIWSDPTGIDITTNKNLKITHDGTGAATGTYEIVAIGVD